MLTLYINTSDNTKIMVAMKINGKELDRFLSEAKLAKSEAVLPLIDKMLKKHKFKKEDLKDIEVFEGPGSFTGLRVGVSIANALGYLLNIPVNGKKIGEIAVPVYN